MSLVKNYHQKPLLTLMVDVPPQSPPEDLVMVLLSSEEDEGPISSDFLHLHEQANPFHG